MSVDSYAEMKAVDTSFVEGVAPNLQIHPPLLEITVGRRSLAHLRSRQRDGESVSVRIYIDSSGYVLLREVPEAC